MTQPKPGNPGHGWRKGQLQPNTYHIDGETIWLTLRSKGAKDTEVCIDAVDLPKVLTRRWCLRWSAGREYVVSPEPRGIAKAEGRARRFSYLHRFLMEPGEELEVDHINGNRLDNRRTNLRVVETQANHENIDRGRGKMRNVCFDKRYPQRGWFAQIQKRPGAFRGYFETREEAIKAAEELRLQFLPHSVESRLK